MNFCRQFRYQLLPTVHIQNITNLIMIWKSSMLLYRHDRYLHKDNILADCTMSRVPSPNQQIVVGVEPFSGAVFTSMSSAQLSDDCFIDWSKDYLKSSFELDILYMCIDLYWPFLREMRMGNSWTVWKINILSSLQYFGRVGGFSKLFWCCQLNAMYRDTVLHGAYIVAK